MKILAIIPARFGSSRFPGKPLADIGGKPMIQRVYERSNEAFESVYVATDDTRIYDFVQSFGGKVVMTSPDHQSGTDRCKEAMERIEASTGVIFDIIVNVQGDEPFISPDQLRQLPECFDSKEVEIATLVKPFDKGEDITNPNSPKVVLSKDNHALYFSRSPIPYIREPFDGEQIFYKHVGLYAYRRDTLLKISGMEQSALELCEKLEQLRWLENGIGIKVAVTNFRTYAIDTPQDIEQLRNLGVF